MRAAATELGRNAPGRACPSGAATPNSTTRWAWSGRSARAADDGWWTRDGRRSTRAPPSGWAIARRRRANAPLLLCGRRLGLARLARLLLLLRQRLAGDLRGLLARGLNHLAARLDVVAGGGQEGFQVQHLLALARLLAAPLPGLKLALLLLVELLRVGLERLRRRRLRVLVDVLHQVAAVGAHLGHERDRILLAGVGEELEHRLDVLLLVEIGDRADHELLERDRLRRRLGRERSAHLLDRTVDVLDGAARFQLLGVALQPLLHLR